MKSGFDFQFYNIRTPYEKLDGFGGSKYHDGDYLPYCDEEFDTILLTSVFTHMRSRRSTTTSRSFTGF